jgi:hypothetical protein
MNFKTHTLLFGIFFSSVLLAQNKPKEGETIATKASSFSISKPLSDYFIDGEYESKEGHRESKDKEHRKVAKYVFRAENGIAYQNDEKNVQRRPGTKSLGSTLTNWEGLGDSGMCPLDPSGAPGVNHYIQAINGTPFKIFNKATGALVGTVSNIGQLWSPATGNLGDPIILYDKYADRWFISQFDENPDRVHIAISTSNNPTGTYYTYTFNMSSFPDYLKFSIWGDGYYMTSNGTNFVNVFERSQMLVGNPNARVITTTIANPASGFWCPLPADADGGLPPGGTPCPFVYFTDNGWGGANTDAMKIKTMTTVWTGTPSLTVSPEISLPLAAFDSSYDSSWNDVEQGVGNQKLDCIGGAIMYRAQWRRWTGYNTIVTCWPVKMGTGKHSTKWVELRQNQTTNAWSVYQEGIYAPDNLSRWIGSISMDDNGSIALGYTVTGKTPTVTPIGLRYTGRLASDPLGQMTFTEKTAATGAGASSCGNRIGDYSQMGLDPDGQTFWFTGTYSDNGYKTKIFSFKINSVLGVDQFENQSAYSVYQSGNLLNITATNIKSENDIVVDLFNVNGKQITGKTIKQNANAIDTSLDVSGLSQGIYLIRIGNIDFQKVVKTIIK